MKKILTFFAIVLALGVYGQDILTQVSEMPYIDSCQFDSDTLRCSAERITSYIDEFYEYPDEAHAARAKGLNVVQFIIEADGSISNIEIVRDAGYGMADELLRVVRAFNDQPSVSWVAAMDKGEKVRYRYSVPYKVEIPVELQESEPLEIAPMSIEKSVVATFPNFNQEIVKVNGTFKNLCPNKKDGHHVSGDGEFGGSVKASAFINLTISKLNDAINAEVGIQFKSNKKDDKTKISAHWDKEIYTAPDGWKISKIAYHDPVKDEKVITTNILCNLYYYRLPKNDTKGKYDDSFGGYVADEALPSASGFEVINCKEGKKHRLIHAKRYDDQDLVIVGDYTLDNLSVYMDVIADTMGKDISHDRDCTCDTRIVSVQIQNLEVILTKY